MSIIPEQRHGDQPAGVTPWPWPCPSWCRGGEQAGGEW